MKNAIFFLLPASALLYGTFAFEEFENGKAFALVAFGCFASLWVNWKRIKHDPVAGALSLFTLSAVISTVLSIAPHISIYGNVKCRAGLLVISSYLVFYLAASQYLTKKSLYQAVDIILATSFVVALYAAIQFLGLDPFQWHQTLSEFGYFRPISLLGHPNFVANYLGMTLPFALWKMSTESRFTQKAAYTVVTLLSLAAILFSLSRGMIIASAVGLVVYAWLSKISIKKISLFCAALAAVAIVSLSFSPRFKDAAFDRMPSLITPGGPRTEYPMTAIRIWKQFPFFGVGTDNFEIGFQNERSAYYWSIEAGGSPHFAHNDFLTILANQGLFGALCALLLTAVAFFRVILSTSQFRVPAASSIAVFYIAGLTSSFIISTVLLFLMCLVFLRGESAP